MNVQPDGTSWGAFARQAHREDRIWFLLSPDHLLTIRKDDAETLPIWSSDDAARKALSSSNGSEELDLCCVPLHEWNSRWVPSLLKENIAVGIDWPTVDDGHVEIAQPT